VKKIRYLSHTTVFLSLGYDGPQLIQTPKGLCHALAIFWPKALPLPFSSP
jgi:hypothetical protein